MKKTFQQIISLMMAMLLLLSTTSWKVEKHYCMGRLMDMALFVDVEDCGMGMALEEVGEYKNTCCDDEVIFIDGQDDLKLSFNDLNVDEQTFLIAFTTSYIDFFRVQKLQFVPHETYPPPLLVKDIQLLDEVFLI